MAKIPDVMSLGELPGPRFSAERRRGSWSTAPMEQTVGAIGQAYRALATGIGELGQGIEQYGQNKGAYETAIAHSQSEAETTALKAQLADPADQDWGTKVQRFQDGAAAINQKWGSTISAPGMAARFQAERNAATASSVAQLQNHVYAGQAEQVNAERTGPLQTSVINGMLSEDDGQKRAEMMRQHGATIDAAQRAGLINPLQAQAEKRKFVTDYQDAYYLKKADTDPAAVIQELDTGLSGRRTITGQVMGDATLKPDTAQFIQERAKGGARVEGLNPLFAERLKNAATDFETQNPGKQASFVSLKRTTEEQAQLYANYRSGAGGLAAPPGRSRHESGNAADLPDGDFRAWLRQPSAANPQISNATQYGLEFLKGHAGAIDRAHVQMAGGPAAPDAGTAPTVSATEPSAGYGAAITHQILKAEGLGRNSASSADGYGQNIASTWTDFVHRYRPDLERDAQGNPVSREAILALRRDPRIGFEITDHIRQENEAQLAKAGVSTEPGYQYLAHFLGPRGAIAIAQAKPDEPVQDVLTKAVGPEWAAKMINANPTVLRGATAGSLAYWAHGKMGGSEIAQLSAQTMDPARREALLERARSNLQKVDAKSEADFNLRYQDTIAQANAGIMPQRPLTLDDFVSKRGPAVGAQLYDQYAADLRVGRDAQSFAVSTPTEIANVLQQYEAPLHNPDSEGFAAAEKRYGEIAKAAAQVQTEKMQDPAAYAIRRLPAVADAWQKMQGAVDPAGAEQAARDFVATTRAEQLRVGVPPEMVKILPKNAIDQIIADIEKPAGGKTPGDIVARIRNQQQIWGDAWPEINREMKSAAPLVSVIAAGPRPAAAQRLVDLGKVTFKDIVSDEHSAKALDIQSAVNDAMVDFGRSLMGNQGAVKTYDNFRGQVEKLAAAYVFQDNMSATDAGRKAVDDVIGHNYEFRDGVRIPAKENPQAIPYSADDMQRAMAAVKARLGGPMGAVDLSVAPLANLFGVNTPAELHEAAGKLYGRDGKWTTSPDEKGVVLTYNGLPVPRPDGQPFMLTWDQLNTVNQNIAGQVDTAARGVKRNVFMPKNPPAPMAPQAQP